MKTTTFNNVTITIQGNPEEAYRKLAELLSVSPVVEAWSTDTYTSEGEAEGDTTDLMPHPPGLEASPIILKG
jgi:hypothetical protein